MDLEDKGRDLHLTLDTILHILRSEGLYASEAALQRELEDRYGDPEVRNSGESDREELYQSYSDYAAHLTNESERDSRDFCRQPQNSQSPLEPISDRQKAAEKDEKGKDGSGRITHDSAQSRPDQNTSDSFRESRSSSQQGLEIYKQKASSVSKDHHGQYKETMTHHDRHGNASMGSLQSPWASTQQNYGLDIDSWLQQGIDEYENEFDVGYIREHVRGQAYFVDTELDLSDDECSSRSMKLYHQALHGSSSQDLAHTDGASDPGHLEGARGTSRISSQSRQGSLTPYSQVSGSSRGNPSISKDRSEIVLLGAVNPTASKQNVMPLVVPPLSEPDLDLSGDRDEDFPQTPVQKRTTTFADSPAAPSTGPASYALSHISSEYCIESPLIHEASLGRHFSHTPEDDEEEEEQLETNVDSPFGNKQSEEPPQSTTGGIWPLGLIGSVGGALGKVFGRGQSQDFSQNAPTQHRDIIQNKQEEPIQSDSVGVEQSCQSLRDLCLAAAEEEPLKLPESILESIPSPSEDGPLKEPPQTPSLFQARACLEDHPSFNPQRRGSEDAKPREPLIMTNQGSGDTQRSGEGVLGDPNFSFPVTPASDGPTTTEPGQVFGTWPSFGSAQSLLRKRQHKGEDASRASSEFDPSGYSTDDGHFSHSDWSRPSSRNEKLEDPHSSRPSSRNTFHQSLTHTLEGTKMSSRKNSQKLPPLPLVEIDASAGNTEEFAAYKNPENASEEERTRNGLGANLADLKQPEENAMPRQKGIFLGPVSPLDTSISLPAKKSLGLLTHQRADSMQSNSSYDAVPAYKPEEEIPDEASLDDQQEIETDEGTTMRTENNASNAEENSGGPADDYSSVVYHWDEDYLHQKYEVFDLKIIQHRRRTGFEESKDIVLHVNDLIAGRYQVTEFLGSAAFSQAVQAIDIKTGALVCLKIIKNNKDYLDQSLDEIKLLKYVNDHDPEDQSGILQLYDYFYFKEHLFLVCELLRANLYEFQKYNHSHGAEPYFILPRVQAIARQVLHSLAFMHSLDLIHCDLKPENILIKSYSKCLVKVIDLGSSCFTTDHLSSYVQSRSYRSPEVILGLPYSQKVDIWSVGCIIAELLSGFVLLQNDSMSTLLTRLEGILGPIPSHMLKDGRFTHRYFTVNGLHFEHNEKSGRYEILRPKRTSLQFRVPQADPLCLQFLSSLLTVDPRNRPSAEEALHHPWLQHDYGYDYTK